MGDMPMRYAGRKTAQISFPVGGIGSGCIGLSGNGNIKDFEINRLIKY